MAKIYTYRQTTTSECGLCCVATVAGYFGYYQPQSFYRKMINVGRDGMSLWDIATCFEKINITSEAYRIEKKELFEMRIGCAYIFCKSNHFYVAIRKNKHSILVCDPAVGCISSSIDNILSSSLPICLILQPGTNFKKCGHRPSEFGYLFSIIRKVWLSIGKIAIYSVIIYLLSLLSQMVIKTIINDIAYSSDFSYGQSLAKILGIFLAIFVLHFVQNTASIKLQADLARKISYNTIVHLFHIRYSFFDNRSQGEVLYRLGFMSQLQQTISSATVQILVSLVGMITIICFLLFYYSFLVPAILTVTLFIIAFSLVINKHLFNYRRKELEAKKSVDSLVTEIVNNMMQIRTMHLSAFFKSSYNTLFEEYLSRFKKTEHRFYNYSSSFSTLFDFLPVLLLLLIIMAIHPQKNILVGEIFILFGILGMFFNQSFVFVTQIAGIGTLKATMVFFNDLVYEPEEPSLGLLEPGDFESLEVRDVSFKYSDGVPNTLDNINMKIACGQCIALVGISGSGKTTLVKLLSKLYTPTNGVILYNSTNLNDISLEHYSKAVVVVPQLPVYFNKSIRDNIILEDHSVGDNEIIDALRIVNFWEEVSEMPFGLDTMVSGQGGNLSGGQIQKISLTRAIIKRPKLLILDEATSSLDPWNENTIYNSLKKAGISLLIISHRFSTVQNADTVFVIEHGKIVEKGTHSTLMQRKGRYYTLYSNEQVEKTV